MPDFDFPVTDCHVHVIGETERYPMTSPRSYTPAPASFDQLDTMLDNTGIERVVVVQLSSHGLDNSCMLDAMAELRHEVRGVVHTGAETGAAELDRLHSKGVRGIRINLKSTGGNDPGVARVKLQQAAAHCARNGWHVQMHTTPAIIAELTDAIEDCPVPVVLDHFGLMSAKDRGGDGESAIRYLLSEGHLWIKLSGTYRLDNPNADTLARDLYSDNSDQLVWGSDWPHTPAHDGIMKHHPELLPNRDFDPADLLADCRRWFADELAMKRIFYSNAQRLYGFGQ